MRNYYRYVSILFFLLLSFETFAQFHTQRDYFLKANGNWFFGQLGMDMKQEPLQLTPTQQFFLSVGSAGSVGGLGVNGIRFANMIPVSDPQTGALRFIATWGQLLDRNFMPMPNGMSIFGLRHSGMGKGIAVVPFINDPDKYYLFYITDEPNGTINYGIINMQLNDGLGDIEPGSKTVLEETMMFDNDALPDIIDVVPGNNCDLWVLFSEAGFSTKKMGIRAYNITAAGVNPDPVVSIIDRENEDDFAWEFQVSPGRDLIAFITGKSYFNGVYEPGDQIDFISFNPDNGSAGRNTMPPIRVKATGFNAHGTFTPDNNYYLIYANEYKYGEATLYQYELDAYGNNYNPVAIPYYFPYAALPAHVSIGYYVPPILFFKPYKNRIFFSIPEANIVPPRREGDLDVDTYLAMRLGQFNPAPDRLWAAPVAGPELELSKFNTFFTGCDVVHPYPPTDTVPSVYFDTVFCFDPGISFSHATLKAKPGFSEYIWNDGTTGDEKLITEPGRYWVYYKGSCNHRVDTFIYRYRVAKKILPPDSVICDQRYPIYLKAKETDGQYLWDDNSASAERTIYYPGTYWVKFSAEGCVEYDTIKLDTKFCPCHVSMPNAFTPNGDGLNDNFRPSIAPGCVPSQYSLRIFNRWGQVVYGSFNEFDQGWDGTDKGKRADAGTYFYEIRFKSRFLDNDYLKKGELILIR